MSDLSNLVDPITMEPLKPTNDLIGNQILLRRVWEAQGYWYFKGVLDLEAIGRLRRKYISVLGALGLVRPGDDDLNFTGNANSKVPTRMEPLIGIGAWEEFVTEPSVLELFRQLLGDEPHWIPIAEYRAQPPRNDRKADRLIGPHQDGFANGSLDFMTCWIPLSNIDADIGGLAIAASLPDCYYHDLNDPPMFRVPLSDIRGIRWLRADYQMGDLLMFHKRMPHTGLHNYSTRFRLSLDARVMRKSDGLPTIGSIASLETDCIIVLTDQGECRSFRIDDETLCRTIQGNHFHRSELASHFQPGHNVIIVGREGGLARVIRPTSSAESGFGMALY